MPYQPKFQITPRLLRLTARIAELKFEIERSAVRLSILPTLKRDSFVRQAHSSTAIEGNDLSLHQVRELASGHAIHAEKKSQVEVGNYFRALKLIASFHAVTQMTEAKLLKCHQVLMAGLLKKESLGCYKSKPNRVVNEKGVTVYLPPSAQVCPKLVHEMIAWQRSPEAKELPPLIVSAILHHRLVSIHPFSDGNGRISRLWASGWLVASSFDRHGLMVLDECYDANRRKYYDKIQQARDLDDDLTYWLEYVAECAIETLEKIIGRVRAVSGQKGKIKIEINVRQEQMLDYLRREGSAKSPQLEKELAVTRSRVQQLMKPLLDAGLIECRGQTRATTYFLK
jgi:Fic family protein